jgi:hypothetical protein
VTPPTAIALVTAGLLAFLILIMAVPQLATWLPDLLRN